MQCISKVYSMQSFKRPILLCNCFSLNVTWFVWVFLQGPKGDPGTVVCMYFLVLVENSPSSLTYGTSE